MEKGRGESGEIKDSHKGPSYVDPKDGGWGGKGYDIPPKHREELGQVEKLEEQKSPTKSPSEN